MPLSINYCLTQAFLHKKSFIPFVFMLLCLPFKSLSDLPSLQKENPLKDYSDINQALPGLKKEYHFGTLERKNLASNPFQQFAHWLEAAVKHQVSKPDAMTLSTASKTGVPSSRIVLLKGFSEDGFIFFSNYASPKGRDLQDNPRASLLFFFHEQERQIRIFGRVKKIPQQDSKRYFQMRPLDAKIASSISAQSKPIANREVLEQKFQALQKKFEGKDIPCPKSWGGYCLIPIWFEFWQGRKHRLNDRFLYKKKGSRWVIERLQP